MAITLKDIASKVGKSVPTVSRALANFDDISPKTREYVQSVAKEMGYVPNNSARKLQSQKAGAVGLILPGTENYLNCSTSVGLTYTWAKEVHSQMK